jgi:hypothetical protein
MTRVKSAFVCVLVTALAAIGTIPPASAQTDTADYRSIIATLDSESYADVEHARQKLLTIGTACVPALTAARRTASEQVKTEIDTLLVQISRESKLGGSFVSLSMRNIHLKDVVAEINRQVPDRPLTLLKEFAVDETLQIDEITVDHEPLWLVVRRLCSDLSLDAYSMDNSIVFWREGAAALMQGPWTVSGPLMVVVKQVGRNRSIQFSHPVLHTDQFSLVITVVAEPKIWLEPGPAFLTVTEAIDDAGNSLLPGAYDHTAFLASASNWSHIIELKYPDKPGKQIKKVAGVLKFNGATEFETIELSDLTAVPTKPMIIAGISYSIVAVNRSDSGKQYEVILEAVGRRGNETDFARLSQVLHCPHLRMYDHDDTRIKVSSGPNRQTSEGMYSVRAAIMFDTTLAQEYSGNRQPAKIVWRVPSRHAERSVPFELTNIPMP